MIEKTSPVEDEKMQTDSEGALSITDYCPEWAYPEGGAKVLIAGPWTESSDQYTVLFDNFPVPSILVQNGLLRCYCPGNCLIYEFLATPLYKCHLERYSFHVIVFVSIENE